MAGILVLPEMATRVRSPDEDTVKLTLDDEELNISSIGLAIAEAIAELKEVQPQALEPLYYSIDTEALDRLIQHSNEGDRTSIQVTFSYDDCNVTIYSETGIRITVTKR